MKIQLKAHIPVFESKNVSYISSKIFTKKTKKSIQDIFERFNIYFVILSNNIMDYDSRQYKNTENYSSTKYL